MLGWMLKRGENAPESGDGDTTQIDQPDTPAPVFAARAFKSALFGTPSKRNDDRRGTRGKASLSGKSKTASQRSSETPSKPQGILLTPGTGTSRRKRVSFGHDVPGGSVTDLDRITEVDEATEAEDPAMVPDSKPQSNSVPEEINLSDDEWEEEEDEEEEGCSSHDITTDLNEPHSQSGRFWKEEFLKYHQEARAELEKLLKYKQLAKSYAQQKDAEAIELAERLRDEQQRVINMERKIAENASQIVTQHRQSSGEDPTELVGKLTKQTTLAAQYRHRVQELESQMEELHMNRDNATGNDTPRRRYASTPSISATQKMLTETRRELRRARSQLKELSSLRDEVFGLKMQLKKAELKLVVSEKEEARATTSGPRAQELRALLKTAMEESKRKDEEIRQLQTDFEAFRKESDIHHTDTKAVLERAHTKIADLKKEVKSLKAAGLGQARPHSWHPNTLSNDKIKETKSDELMRDAVQTSERRSLDETNNLDKPQAQTRTLRQKFVDDAALAAPEPKMSNGGDRAHLAKPKWQPFVPRSPRNRVYNREDVARRIHGDKSKGIVAPELPALAKTMNRHKNISEAEENGEVDLLSDRFARLGGPGPNNHIIDSLEGNASRSALPPERRAAALARIEKRMAEKKKLRSQSGAGGKENVRPV
ncbi:hypothetical protein QQS21_007120 [Conoideocrella luteorostrata]|uniref:Spindle pole body-associated protein cut12 domain-containing protein n=1 Tax=Conoideocrella luteorostrata TaxID=1105319 RepID=A0AAJ0CLB2_9HYPO|nr:hypothetical protein QQS21_007120 [Conoideocrella luteorostrata]